MFLTEASKTSVKISDDIIEEFGEACKEAFKKQFTEKRKKKFTYRMSNIGKPLCQLKMEKNGVEGDSIPYNAKMRHLFGDLIEASAVAIMKSAGVQIEDTQKKVSHNFNGDKINGTLDVKIDGKVWDIKSASPYAFESKFGENGGFDAVIKEDSFGYATQGYLYGEADKASFGGWIVVNKSTGEWCVTETPLEDTEHKERALSTAKTNIKKLKNNEPFERCFEDKEEHFYKKPTGNRVLGFVCSYCSYKRKCWGDNLQYLPQQQSQGKNPKWLWYTKVDNPRVDEN